MKSERVKKGSVGRNRLRWSISLALVVFLVSVYATRPDWAQMIHWWPLVVWTPLVLLPFVPFFWRYGRMPLVLCLLWAGLIFGSDGGWRWLRVPEQKSGIRVVSLNIEGGDAEAMREALSVDAELVLLQEVAGKAEVEGLARAAGYPYAVVGLDTAIVSRVPLFRPVLDRDFVSAECRVGADLTRVTSLRLFPPVFRLDFHNPAAWAEYGRDIGARRARLAEILKAAPSGLVGGDFNCTNPTMMRGYSMAESSVAGRGWPGTGTNDFPFVRVDQIWGDMGFRFIQSFVRKTKHSDHRMVVVDFDSASGSR